MNELLGEKVLRIFSKCSQKDRLSFTWCHWSCMTSMNNCNDQYGLMYGCVCKTIVQRTIIHWTVVQPSIYFYQMYMATFRHSAWLLRFVSAPVYYTRPINTMYTGWHLPSHWCGWSVFRPLCSCVAQAPCAPCGSRCGLLVGSDSGRQVQKGWSQQRRFWWTARVTWQLFLEKWWWSGAGSWTHLSPCSKSPRSVIRVCWEHSPYLCQGHLSITQNARPIMYLVMPLGFNHSGY